MGHEQTGAFSEGLPAQAGMVRASAEVHDRAAARVGIRVARPRTSFTGRRRPVLALRRLAGQHNRRPARRCPSRGLIPPGLTGGAQRGRQATCGTNGWSVSTWSLLVLLSDQASSSTVEASAARGFHVNLFRLLKSSMGCTSTAVEAAAGSRTRAR